MKTAARALLALALFASMLSVTPPALADEASIRKNIAERLPDFPKIDEVGKTNIPGIYEIRIGTDILYTDENGAYMFEGQIIETKTRTNITEARIAKLTAIDFKTLPLKDAVVWKNGNGDRKMVVFADPNCGYCKKFERDLLEVKNITVYTFLYPILGADSTSKSQAIWCAKDNTKAWRDWMTKGTAVTDSPACDTSALQRNVALGRKYRINGTPGIVFEDGKHMPGAIGVEQIEKQLVTSRGAAKG